MDFARRDHGGDAAVQKTVDPADLVLPRRPVAGDGMNVAVDQAGRNSGAIGIDDGGGAFGIDVRGAADGGDPAVLGDDGVGIEDRLLHGAGEHEPDIADHQFGRAGGLGFVVRHGFFLVVQCLRKAVARHLARGLTDRSSRIIHLYTNNCIRMIKAAQIDLQRAES